MVVTVMGNCTIEEEKPEAYWQDHLLDLVVEVLFKEVETPLGGASREEARMEQVALPGLFALVEE